LGYIKVDIRDGKSGKLFKKCKQWVFYSRAFLKSILTDHRPCLVY